MSEPTTTNTPPADESDYPGRWICNLSDCGEPVEANPALYLSLQSDGTWSIDGVGDESAPVVCANGHSQENEELSRSMSAFLEESFPGGTWATSANTRNQN